MDPEKEYDTFEWYRELIAAEEYGDLLECVRDAGEDGVKVFYEAILGDCEGPYVERMAENAVAIFTISLDNEVDSLLELERFVATERPGRLAEFPSMIKFMYEDENVCGEDVTEWATSLEAAVQRGTPEEAARRARELCESVVRWIEGQTDTRKQKGGALPLFYA